MFGIRPFLLGLLMGAGGGLFAANYHVVNTAEGVVVVAKPEVHDRCEAYLFVIPSAARNLVSLATNRHP